jgi:hypothetical protein
MKPSVVCYYYTVIAFLVLDDYYCSFVALSTSLHARTPAPIDSPHMYQSL